MHLLFILKWFMSVALREGVGLNSELLTTTSPIWEAFTPAQPGGRAASGSRGGWAAVARGCAGSSALGEEPMPAARQLPWQCARGGAQAGCPPAARRLPASCPPAARRTRLPQQLLDGAEACELELHASVLHIHDGTINTRQPCKVLVGGARAPVSQLWRAAQAASHPPRPAPQRHKAQGRQSGTSEGLDVRPAGLLPGDLACPLQARAESAHKPPHRAACGQAAHSAGRHSQGDTMVRSPRPLRKTIFL